MAPGDGARLYGPGGCLGAVGSGLGWTHRVLHVTRPLKVRMPWGLRLVGRALSWLVGAAVLRPARVSPCWGQEMLPWLLSTSDMRRRAWSWERVDSLVLRPQPTKLDEARAGSGCARWGRGTCGACLLTFCVFGESR